MSAKIILWFIENHTELVCEHKLSPKLYKLRRTTTKRYVVKSDIRGDDENYALINVISTGAYTFLEVAVTPSTFKGFSVAYKI